VFVVGHDWGAIIAWYLCLFRPDRVTALVNTSVAFMRSVFIRTGPNAVKTTDHFNRAYGPTYYICRFQVTHQPHPLLLLILSLHSTLVADSPCRFHCWPSTKLPMQTPEDRNLLKMY
jgi:pimeloyl-ACP methyl ester carboxylesterase